MGCTDSGVTKLAAARSPFAGVLNVGLLNGVLGSGGMGLPGFLAGTNCPFRTWIFRSSGAWVVDCFGMGFLNTGSLTSTGAWPLGLDAGGDGGLACDPGLPNAWALASDLWMLGLDTGGDDNGIGDGRLARDVGRHWTLASTGAWVLGLHPALITALPSTGAWVGNGVTSIHSLSLSL